MCSMYVHSHGMQRSTIQRKLFLTVVQNYKLNTYLTVKLEPMVHNTSLYN